MKRIAIIMLIISASASASKTYTPQQLNQMINNGVYPDQSDVGNTQTQSMAFITCKATVENIMSQIRVSYPVKNIADTSILYMVKAWTNDGAVTATCSKPDKKLVLTQASYR